MNETHIKKLCLILSIVGLFLLYVVILMQNTMPIKIINLNDDYIGDKIKTCGTLKSQRYSDGGTFFIALFDEITINTVFFNTQFEIQEYDINDVVCVTGRLKKYNNELEIVGEKITKI